MLHAHFLTWQICLLKLFAKIEFLAKIHEFTVFVRLFPSFVFLHTLYVSLFPLNVIYVTSI